MIELIENILVVGHHNPDTDAAAAACGYAEFLNQIGRYEMKAVGAIPGELTPQARYVFDRAGVTPPIVINNVSPRVGHVMNQKPNVVHVHDHVGDAIQKLIRHDLSMLPIVDGSGKLTGAFSHRSEASKFLMGLDPTPMWGTLLTLDDVKTMPGIEILQRPENTGNCDGNLIVALTGDSDWKSDINRDDVLICGELDCLDSLSEERLPGAVILVRAAADRPSPVPASLRNCWVIQYEQSIAELLRSMAMHIQLGSLSLPTGPCVGKLDRVDDIRQLLNENYHALPVLADCGKFEGIISRSDMQGENRCKVILVDHFEFPQAVPGIDTAEVIEIVDHHRVGDIETGSPIRVECRPVGSSCTIVASNFFESNATLSSGHAMILLGGIVADTLVLTGPTTTDVDREIAPRLAEIAGVDLKTFGTDVLIAGDDLATSNPEDIWNRDQKQFSIRNQNFAVAQLETASLEHLPEEKLADFQKLVEQDQKANGRILSLLALTDVIKGDSWMFCSESDGATGVARETFTELEPKPGWVAAPGVVSRKKQIVPQLMQNLSKV